ncbi:glucose 1-dehydrogenase [Novosphingobium sp. Gsoil 351]|uniref:glucose 1-dehydrogenase n=1 Tax=Novosphingobium sp. Gsoil 351 TaxID=2675225 RepID=UPI0012B444FB|nr:glucose 1-dehydrogenase [Novosphingobium sp. Gsoil 351]QGN55685.1 glucose 1-dehydrogenase [Novosphingobium sp. Gsoil 351]
MNGRVAGKVVIVTGGARGQGAAHARRLAGEGACVIVADLREDQAQALAADLPNGAWAMRHDVANPADWDRLIARVGERHGRLDGLVNNAGIAIMADLGATDLATYQRTISINQTGTYLGMAAASSLMKATGGGSIVNISSIAGIKADPLFFAYTASKWAVRGMTRAAARSLAPDRIRVNVVMPGIIDTPMLTEAVPGLDVAGFAAGATPLGRAGQPDEVAMAIVYLISDESAFVTGAELAVDGGIVA